MRSPPRQTGGFRSARGRRNDGRALRAQFHGEAGNEALPGRSRSLDAVDAVAPMLTIGGSSGVQHDIAVSGAAQRVRLDPPDRSLILEVHQQAVGGREADDLQIRLNPARDRKAQGTLPEQGFARSHPVRGRFGGRHACLEPGKELGQWCCHGNWLVSAPGGE